MKQEKSALNVALAAEIRAERTAQKMPVKELAERAHMVVSTLNRALAGERDINITQAASIAVALDVPLETLMRRAVDRMGGLEALFDAVDEEGDRAARPTRADLPVSP